MFKFLVLLHFDLYVQFSTAIWLLHGNKANAVKVMLRNMSLLCWYNLCFMHFLETIMLYCCFTIQFFYCLLATGTKNIMDDYIFSAGCITSNNLFCSMETNTFVQRFHGMQSTTKFQWFATVRFLSIYLVLLWTRSHYSITHRANVGWEACSRLLGMVTAGNRTPHLVI